MNDVFFILHEKKIEAALMIAGLIPLPILMFFYTLVYLMADWPPLGPMEYLVVSIGSFGGILLIASVAISFFKKSFKVGIIGSIFFSSLFIVAGIQFFLSGGSNFALWLIFSSAPMLIILGALLRIFQNRKVLRIIYWLSFLTLLIYIPAALFVLFLFLVNITS